MTGVSVEDDLLLPFLSGSRENLQVGHLTVGVQVECQAKLRHTKTSITNSARFGLISVSTNKSTIRGDLIKLRTKAEPITTKGYLSSKISV